MGLGKWHDLRQLSLRCRQALPTMCSDERSSLLWVLRACRHESTFQLIRLTIPHRELITSTRKSHREWRLQPVILKGRNTRVILPTRTPCKIPSSDNPSRVLKDGLITHLVLAYTLLENKAPLTNWKGPSMAPKHSTEQSNKKKTRGDFRYVSMQTQK